MSNKSAVTTSSIFTALVEIANESGVDIEESELRKIAQEFAQSGLVIVDKKSHERGKALSDQADRIRMLVS